MTASPTTAARPVSDRTAFAVGVVAGAVFTVVLLALRVLLDTQVVSEVLADWITRLLPPELFDALLERLQFGAKPLLFSLIQLGQVGVGGGIGILYARAAGGTVSVRARLRRVGLLTVYFWLALAFLATPLLGGGFFGSFVPGGMGAYSLSLAVALVAFSYTLVQLHHVLVLRADSGTDSGRRALLRQGLLAAGLVVVGGGLVRLLLTMSGRLSPPRRSAAQGALVQEVTPNDEFYVIAKSLFTPRVDAADWRLAVDVGGTPLSISYEELRALPAVEEFVTLNCVSNRVGGDLISNALWKGVPLRDVLRQAQLPTSAERLAFYAADGYVDSFPVEWALREQTLIAYEMNGVPLPPEHGFPARIIVPGLYGMENVKWLERIESVPASFRGYWQRRGWKDTAVIKTMSRIDLPAGGSNLATGVHTIGGIAFAGDRGVERVEVSIDGGATWKEASRRPPLSPYTWVLWTVDCELSEAGDGHELVVRATDGQGRLQTAEVRGSLPDGATGYHRVDVAVNEATGA